MINERFVKQEVHGKQNGICMVRVTRICTYFRGLKGTLKYTVETSFMAADQLSRVGIIFIFQLITKSL